jgi:hypothetical protein
MITQHRAKLRMLCGARPAIITLAVVAAVIAIGPASSAGATRTCIVPQLRGKTLAAAKQAIAKSRCRLGAVRRVYSSAVKKGLVISQKPPAGRRVAAGSAVSIVVSRGKKPPSLPQAGSVAATIPLESNVTAVAATDSAVWVLTENRHLVRVDPASNNVVATLSLPESEWPEGTVAVGDGAVWVTVASPSTNDQPQLDSLLRIDPQTNTIAARIHVGHSPIGIAITPDSVWTANHRSEWDAQANDATGTYDVSRVAVASNTEVTRPVVETRAKGSDPHAYWCCGPTGITFAAGSLWTTDPQDSDKGFIARLDTTTNTVIARIPFANSKAAACGDVVGDDSALWMISGCETPYVVRIDPRTNRVAATIDAGSEAKAIALGFSSVWVATTGRLSRIDPATNALVARTNVSFASAVATGAGAVWVGSGPKLLRLTPR